MNWQQYEQAKKQLKAVDKYPTDYEKRIKEILKKLEEK